MTKLSVMIDSLCLELSIMYIANMFLSQLQQNSSPHFPAWPKLRAAKAKASPTSRALPCASSAWKNVCLRSWKATLSLMRSWTRQAALAIRRFEGRLGPHTVSRRLAYHWFILIHVLFCEQLLSKSSSSCRFFSPRNSDKMWNSERTNYPMILVILFPSHGVRPWPTLEKLTWTPLESIPGLLV